MDVTRIIGVISALALVIASLAGCGCQLHSSAAAEHEGCSPSDATAFWAEAGCCVDSCSIDQDAARELATSTLTAHIDSFVPETLVVADIGVPLAVRRAPRVVANAPTVLRI